MSKLFGGILVGFGVVVTAGGILHIIQARGSTSWPSVQGKIIKSEVKKLRQGKINHKKIGTRSPRKRPQFLPDIEYTYEVNGQQFTGKQVAFMTEYGKENAEQMTRKYAIGKMVTVFYNPKHPTHCTLEVGMSSSVYLLPIIGVGMLACGVALLL